MKPQPRPRYIEAYPTCAARALIEAVANRKTQSVWRDEQGRIACKALVSEQRPHVFSVTWALMAGTLDYITERHGDAILTLTEDALGANTRLLFLCPQCGASAIRLAIAETGWGCRACHKFRYASQLRETVASADPFRSNVRASVRAGKPHGQSNDQRRRVVRSLEKADASRPIPLQLSRYTQRLSVAEWHGLHEELDDRDGEDLVFERDAFPYYEAYASIDAAAARRALKAGTPLCLWRAGASIIGGAEVEQTGTSLKMRYALHRTRWHQGADGEAVFEIVPTGSQENNKRWLLRCPGCGAPRSSLTLLKSIWACRACHGLGYRKSMVGTAVRRAEEVQRLETELDRLIASRAHLSRIKRLQAMLVSAREAAGEAPYPVASRRYIYVVQSNWQSQPFANDGFYNDIGDVAGYGDARPGPAPPAKAPNKDPVMEKSVPRSTSAPLVCSAALEQATFGKDWLFKGQSSDDFLREKLRGLIAGVCAVAARKSPQLPPVARLVEQVVTEWHVERLLLTNRVADEWVRPHETSYYGEEIYDHTTHTLATIYVALFGNGAWVNVAPRGADDLRLKGRLAHGRLELTVRVPVAETEHVYDLLKEGIELVRRTIDRQMDELASFKSKLPEHATPMIVEHLRRNQALKDLPARLKGIEF